FRPGRANLSASRPLFRVLASVWGEGSKDLPPLLDRASFLFTIRFLIGTTAISGYQQTLRDFTEATASNPALSGYTLAVHRTASDTASRWAMKIIALRVHES